MAPIWPVLRELFVMKWKTKVAANEAPDFTMAEHLNVQFRIERRAHELWLLNGCRHRSSIDDWIQAELEITADFIRTRSRDVRRAQAAEKEHQPGKTASTNESSRYHLDFTALTMEIH
jgi:hypothetical protein